MAQINLGRIIPVFKGEWDNRIVYDKLDVVYYGGCSFIALKSNTGVTPNIEGSNETWMMLAKGGSFEGLTEDQITQIAIELGTLRYIKGTGNYNEFV